MTTATKSAPAYPQRRLAPGPRGQFPFGSMGDFRRDPLGWLLELARAYGDVVRTRFVFSDGYFVFHPDHVRLVLQERNRNYQRGDFANRLLRMLTGESILTTDGEYWLRQRRMMQPAFHRKRIAAFGETMTAFAGDMAAAWRNWPASEPLDVAEEMMRLTLRIAGKTLFGIETRADEDIIGKATTYNLQFFMYRSQNFPFVPLFIPIGINRRMKWAQKALDAIIYRMIREGRARPAADDNLLTMLLEARDEETGEGMSDEQVRNELLTLLTAGHETTANALTWAFYLLSQHPDVEARLVTEINVVLSGRVPTMEDLPKLGYLRMVCDETMRLYPPAWAIGRLAVTTDEIGGYTIPAQAGVTVSPYVTHRHPEFWPQPDRFDPERFAPERAKDRHPYAFFPFGGGPHLCIGNIFAQTEMQLLLATLLPQFRLRHAPGHDATPQPLVTLRPKTGMLMLVEPRAD